MNYVGHLQKSIVDSVTNIYGILFIITFSLVSGAFGLYHFWRLSRNSEKSAEKLDPAILPPGAFFILAVVSSGALLPYCHSHALRYILFSFVCFMKSHLSRAFVLKQLMLKRWRGRLTWRKPNIVLPISNVSTSSAVTGSTAATSLKTFAKKSSYPSQLGGSYATKVDSAPPIKGTIISSASTSAYVETGDTFGARTKDFGARTKDFGARTKDFGVRTKDFGVRSKGRLSAHAGANAHKSQLHSHFIDLDDCLSESNNCNEMRIHMKTLAKVAD